MLQHSHIPKSTKTITLTSSVSLISLFSLFDSKKNPIATNLTYTQVKPISEHIPDCIIKFERMSRDGVS